MYTMLTIQAIRRGGGDNKGPILDELQIHVIVWYIVYLDGSVPVRSGYRRMILDFDPITEE